MTRVADRKAQFQRTETGTRPEIRLTIDGEASDALQGDTVLTAVLVHGRKVRGFEFGNEGRAGFCLIGACQDCWVSLAGGRRVRACTTVVEPGMHVLTEVPNDE